MSTERLKWVAILSFVIALGGLLFGGYQTRSRLAPYPGRVVDPGGTVLLTRADILAGQDVYQRYGLMDHGSVWGHGSQRGMEFSAVTLHRWGVAVRDQIALAANAKAYDQLASGDRQAVDGRTVAEMKGNHYDAGSDTLTLTAAQAAALPDLYQLWETTFAAGDARYGFPPDTVKAPEERRHIASFFVWTAWAAVANWPGAEFSYTNNWPPDRTVGNQPSAETYIWTLGGVLGLFPVGIAQTWTAFKYGLWAARDASFFERGLVQVIGNLRALPDLMIIVLGVIPLTIFLFRTYPHLKAVEIGEGESLWDRLGFKP